MYYTDSLLQAQRTWWGHSLTESIPEQRHVLDVAKHTHKHIREAEDSGQKARGPSSTKSQVSKSHPGSSLRHLARPSYMLQACFFVCFMPVGSTGYPRQNLLLFALQKTPHPSLPPLP